MGGTGFIPKAVLDETLIMEQISKSPHPHIIKYHGCRVKRGRITAIYISTPGFQDVDKAHFIEDLESAANYLHSLGLAHNDINADNIVVRDGMPVLKEFGSCQPSGMPLQPLGTFSLKKLRQWLQDPGVKNDGGRVRVISGTR
ncbi:Serine/threonine-protein kinase/endoribonuclease IRE2 [Chaetomidium leptoderma]|uniref:Serine/threonine-protein kinase/endoribonuclease IRE2 n=1 Tax=Chaetomidium leptoderma TaxID=669021 RepID=A0AAN6ZTP9_9PEZI|nr:Serine/threonine-protein kinase/endoribonuclease IRE2 [Chaetomidium leptoderma]